MVGAAGETIMMSSLIDAIVIAGHTKNTAGTNGRVLFATVKVMIATKKKCCAINKYCK